MTSSAPIRSSDPSLRQGLVIPAILCGGSGSRLWPVSRKDFAKQHVPILGGASPFQRTLGRLSDELFGAPIALRQAAETGGDRDIKQARAMFLKLRPADRRAALASLTE